MQKISKLPKFVTAQEGSPPLMKDIFSLLNECAYAKGGEVSARAHAKTLADMYLRLDKKDRKSFLQVLSFEYSPDYARLAEAFTKYSVAADIQSRCNAEIALRTVMYSPRKRILTQFNAIPAGIKFLVDLRAELLDFMKELPELNVLDSELKDCLASWFDVGFLDLVRLTWNSPAAVLEKLIKYEAVHKVASWRNLKKRLDEGDRRCYAFFHPKMPVEPLIFVNVVLTDKLEDNIQNLLDENTPSNDASQATTAIFYSISNCQYGLRGISFGNFLLKRVIDSMSRDFPKIKNFATLSPIPGLIKWMENNPEELTGACYPSDWKYLAKAGVTSPQSPIFRDIVKNPQKYFDNTELITALKTPLIRTAAKFLTTLHADGRPIDFVARFHLGNGARVEKLNWMADNSPKGVSQSLGLMVNYLYDISKLEKNIEKFTVEGKISASSAIKEMTERVSDSK
ncbi:MAG: malonyl-CoA decarboxylase [Deferribacteraceae bacterium]|jgi:malonyl-CoA decarboxylase|nr:malonyl-CoA decarboxylase [Deferribacteraceae bacterium]